MRDAAYSPSLWCSSLALLARRWARRSPAVAAQIALTPLVERDDRARRHDGAAGAAGATSPDGLHVQSNKPRDPSLIADDAHDRRAGGRVGRARSCSRQPPTSSCRVRTSRSPCSSETSSSACSWPSARTSAPGTIDDARRSCAIRRATTRCASRRRRSHVAVDAARRAGAGRAGPGSTPDVFGRSRSARREAPAGGARPRPSLAGRRAPTPAGGRDPGGRSCPARSTSTIRGSRAATWTRRSS